MTTVDVVVVGGGVAGSASAMALRDSGYSVRILHRPNRATGFEALSPLAVAALARLSVDVGIEFRDVIAWWHPPYPTRRVYDGARIVDRRTLADALLQQAIVRGADVQQFETIRNLDRERGQWQLEFALERGHGIIRVPYLVDATGRTAVIARRLGARRTLYDDLCATTMSVVPTSGVGLWTERCRDGWWNLTAAVGAGTLSFFSSPTLISCARGHFEACLSHTARMKQLVQSTLFPSLGTRPASSSLLSRCAGPNWCAVGDAASTLQPLASAGVAKALRDAECVPAAFNNGHAEYDERRQHDFTDYLEQLRQHYAARNVPLVV